MVVVAIGSYMPEGILPGEAEGEGRGGRLNTFPSISLRTLKLEIIWLCSSSLERSDRILDLRDGDIVYAV